MHFKCDLDRKILSALHVEILSNLEINVYLLLQEQNMPIVNDVEVANFHPEKTINNF